MNDYYNLFVELSLQQCRKCDYSNKQKVKVHNTVLKKLTCLQNRMKETDCRELLARLLDYEDERVKINAGKCCLQWEILVEKAVFTLNEIINTSDDPTFRLSACEVLKTRKPRGQGDGSLSCNDSCIIKR